MDDRKKKNTDAELNEASTTEAGNDTPVEETGSVTDSFEKVSDHDNVMMPAELEFDPDNAAEIMQSIADATGPAIKPKREKIERNEVRWANLAKHNIIVAAMVGAGGSSLTKYGDPDDGCNIVRTISVLADQPSEFSSIEACDGNHYSANDYQIIGGDIGISASIRSIYMTMDAQEHATPLTEGNGVVLGTGKDIGEADVLSPDGLRNAITRLVEASKGRFNPPMIAFSKNDHAMDEFEVIPLGETGYVGSDMREFIIGKGGSFTEVVAYLSGVRLPQAMEKFGRTVPLAGRVFFVESLIPQLKGGYRKEG